MRRLVLAFLFTLGIVSAAHAQAGSLVQQSGSRLDAATAVAVSTNYNTVNTQAIATITVPAGHTAFGIKVYYYFAP